MARISRGILGGFSGKVGTVIGYSQDNNDYMKSAPVKGRRKKSTNPGEIANRDKFAIAQDFLSPLTAVVREGFRSERKGRGFVDAKGHLLKNAFEGNLEEQKINPAKVVLSIGDLHLPTNITCSKGKPGWLDISWDPVAKWAADAKDQVMTVAYDIEGKFVFVNIAGEFRYKGAESIEVYSKPGHKLHLYLAFISADRKQRSESVYLGEWTT